MTREQLQRRLKELKAELEDIYSMSDENACDLYHVDSKAEVVEMAEEEIGSIQAQLDKMLDPDAEVERGLFHFAFASETSYWRYKY